MLGTGVRRRRCRVCRAGGRAGHRRALTLFFDNNYRGGVLLEKQGFSKQPGPVDTSPTAVLAKNGQLRAAFVSPREHCGNTVLYSDSCSRGLRCIVTTSTEVGPTRTILESLRQRNHAYWPACQLARDPTERLGVAAVLHGESS